MPTNKGKAFEAKFKMDFQQSFPEGTIDRIYDSVTGYKSISNISDFIGYNYPYMYYLECKSHLGNTFPLTKLTQYDALLPKVGIKGVRAGVVLWFIDHDTIVYVPISSVTKMKEDGKKSVNIKMLDDDTYRLIKIPTQKKRTFLDGDFSVLASLQDGD
jgi:hypothetical protein